MVAFKVFAGILFGIFPAVVEVTSTDTVQCPLLWLSLAGTVPPINVSVFPIVVTVPPQSVVMFAGFAKLNLASSVFVQAGSGRLDKVKGKALGL